ncbi:MAG: type III pantothenate kinase [Halanaerobium sp.]|nr:type III pantothenate kinase [Halanaerobium sp.]
MLLAFDVGNTNMVLGVFKEDELLSDWRVYSERHKTADEYGALFIQLLREEEIGADDIDRVIISSVVPPLTASLSGMVRKYFKQEPLIVNSNNKLNIRIKLENPGEVGADRLVNAVAAYEKYGGPLIIIDFGTATTFCAVSGAGEYLGGAIAPGIGISTEALFDYAAKLPRIELKKPPRAIGSNTIASMQSGIVFGYAGQVKYLVEKFKDELSPDARVIATGGLASFVAEEYSEFDEVNPYLTLEGLKILDELNR